MRKVFADTGYWLAVVNKRDELHETALARSQPGGAILTVTSELVLAEFLNHLARGGPALRKAAAEAVEELRNNRSCEVVPWSARLFGAGFSLYKNRPDKHWSLTDCTSFVIMYERNISEALASDKHFEQAGFKALLR